MNAEVKTWTVRFTHRARLLEQDDRGFVGPEWLLMATLVQVGAGFVLYSIFKRVDWPLWPAIVFGCFAGVFLGTYLWITVPEVLANRALRHRRSASQGE